MIAAISVSLEFQLLIQVCGMGIFLAIYFMYILEQKWNLCKFVILKKLNFQSIFLLALFCKI